MFNTRGPHAGSPRGVLVPVVRTAKTLNTLSRTGGDSMKAYLITTGTLFGLFAAMHLVRVVEKWHLLATDPWFVLGNALIAVPSGALCLWAWRLFWRPR